MITSFHANQGPISVVMLNHTLQVCAFFPVKHGTEPSSCSPYTEVLQSSVLPVLASGLMAQSVHSSRCSKIIQSKIPEHLFNMCEKEVEEHSGTRCQIPGVLQERKSSRVMHCCSDCLLRTEAFSDLFALSCIAETHDML